MKLNVASSLQIPPNGKINAKPRKSEWFVRIEFHLSSIKALQLQAAGTQVLAFENVFLGLG